MSDVKTGNERTAKDAKNTKVRRKKRVFRYLFCIFTKLGCSQRKSKERIKLGVEFTSLKSKYQLTNYNIDWVVSPLYFILVKIDSCEVLTEKKYNWLISNGFSKINTLAIETRRFFNLKSKYKAIEYHNYYLDSPLYPILKKIDVAERLTESEYKWLQENQLLDTLEFVKQQEAERRNEFVELKEKYQATKYKSKSVSSPLYNILKKLASQESLIDTEIAWLADNIPGIKTC